MSQVKANKWSRYVLFALLIAVAAFVIFPIAVVVINSFKNRFMISSAPFALPNSESFLGFANYVNGLFKIGFLKAFGFSLWITVASVIGILLVTSMLAWYITRIKSTVTTIIYYCLVFSMIVPFQMVMFTMTKFANMLHLDNPIGIIVLYVGFGAGMASFMFSGFIKSVPLALEEAAMIDGCNPLQTYFHIVLPILKPTSITVAILNAMWVWNDYLLPYLVIGLSTKYKTIPVVIQMLVGSNGNRDMGAMMAMLVLAIIPIVVFYLACQKHIIEGVVAGAVKG